MSKAWPRVKLGDVLSLDLNKVAIDPSRSYPMVGVLSFGRGLFEREPIDNGNTSYKHFLRLRKNHFVMSQLFGWEGALAISDEEFDGKFVSPQFPTFVCDERRLNLSYLGWCVRRKVFWDELSTRTNGMGDRRRTLNPAALFASEIALPPLEEQQRIVARIDAVQQHLHAVDKLRTSIDQDIASLLAARFQETLKQAKWLPMREVAPLVRRNVQLESNHQYKELGARSFGKGLFVKPNFDADATTWEKPVWIKAGDIVFSNIKAWEGAIGVAKVEHDGFIASHRYLTAVAQPEIALPEYLLYYMLSEVGLTAVNEASPGTADRNRTTKQSALEAIRVPVPSMAIQKQFVKLKEALERAAEVRTKQRVSIEAMLPALCNQVLSQQ
jgi:type I restriction enzyme, S subunit